MNKIKTYLLLIVCLAGMLRTLPAIAQCPDNQAERNTVVDEQLSYLLSLASPKTTTPFNVEKVDCLLNFVQHGDIDPEYQPGEINGTVSAFYAFTLNTSMSKLLRYCYGPELAPYLTMPSAIRSAAWLEIDGKPQTSEPNLAELLPTLTEPFSYSGVSHQSLTPDINTGTYFSYDEDRCLILIPGTTPTFISISVQRDKSDIGQKGAVIGDDSQWIYLYSGERGVTKRGLGWAKCYLYNSYSVAIYTETASNTLDVATFKWLDAGWSGLNMAKTKHLIHGMKRFSSTLKHIMESNKLPSVEQLLVEQNQIRAYSLDDLRLKVKPYINTVAALNDPLTKRKPFSKQLSSGEYLNMLSRTDMEKILFTEHLKRQLGDRVVVTD